MYELAVHAWPVLETVQHRYRVDCLQLHTIMFTYIAIKSQSFSPKMVHAYAVAPRFFLFEPLISAPVILPPPSNAALTLPSLAAAASDAALSTADSEGGKGWEEEGYRSISKEGETREK